LGKSEVLFARRFGSPGEFLGRHPSHRAIRHQYIAAARGRVLFVGQDGVGRAFGEIVRYPAIPKTNVLAAHQPADRGWVALFQNGLDVLNVAGPAAADVVVVVVGEADILQVLPRPRIAAATTATAATAVGVVFLARRQHDDEHDQADQQDAAAGGQADDQAGVALLLALAWAVIVIVVVACSAWAVVFVIRTARLPRRRITLVVICWPSTT